MIITECKVNPVENMGRVRGFCSMVIDEAVVIRGVRIMDSKNGLTVSFPQRQNSKGEYDDIVKPITKEAYMMIAEHVISAYTEAVQEQKRSATVNQMVQNGQEHYRKRTGNAHPGNSTDRNVRIEADYTGNEGGLNRNAGYHRNAAGRH